MAHYYVGDEPRGTVAIAPASIEDAAAYPEADADMRAPSGAVQPLAATVATVDGDTTVTVDLAGLVLDEVGVWQLTVTLSDPAEGAQRIRAARPVRIPVEDPASPWYLIEQARRDWSGAPDDDARLHDLLDVARGQVVAFAPTLAVDAPVPERYRQAQLMQARNIWNAQQIDPGASTYEGGDGFTIRVYPLDWAVQQMLRPRRAVPRVG